MPKFRKKPIEIDAVQWFPGVEHPGVTVLLGRAPAPSRYFVTTIHEQPVYLAPGDWIIPEKKEGRYYPVKPDVFAETYDPLPSTPPPDRMPAVWPDTGPGGLE